MELKEFVQATLVSVGEALAASRGALQAVGVEVAPSDGPPSCTVRFDLAVEARGDGSGIDVLAAPDPGAKPSRVRFAVPLGYSAGAAAAPGQPVSDLDWE